MPLVSPSVKRMKKLDGGGCKAGRNCFNHPSDGVCGEKPKCLGPDPLYQCRRVWHNNIVVTGTRGFDRSVLWQIASRGAITLVNPVAKS